jgi:hypothetical protein
LRFNPWALVAWPAPTTTLVCHDDQYATVTVQAWAGLHPKQHRHPGHGSGGPRPIVRGTIIRVAVKRIPAKTRQPKVLWLWWAGPDRPDLEVVWRAYTRRFDLEHTIRFANQTLGWTTRRLRHPAQAERWTWLVVAGYTQLRLAKTVVADHRLAWERPRPPGQLSPYRVRRGVSRLLCVWVAGRRAETLRPLPRQTPRQPHRPRRPPPGDQKTYQQAQEQAADDGEGRLTGQPTLNPRRPRSMGTTMPDGLKRKLRPRTASLLSPK